MKNIILTSCGVRNDNFKNEFYKIISKEELESKKVLYITTASIIEDDKSWMDAEYNSIIDLGVRKENIHEYHIGESKEDVMDYDIMYMMGGNTFYLLDVIRKNNFDKVIVDFINNNKIYIGSSAGSVICGNSIETSIKFDDNIVNMKDFTGLKLIDGSVIPHSNKKLEFINDLKGKTNENLILLYDGDGIII